MERSLKSSKHFLNSKIAQLVEHSVVTRKVGGSLPSLGAILWEYRIAAIAGDCKSPGLTPFVGASPTAPTILKIVCSSVGRAEYLTMG